MRGWLLDTNVVSELIRPRPEPKVVEWVRSLPRQRVSLSVLTLAEIDQGIEGLRPADLRRDRLVAFRSRIEAEFADRVLPLEDETVRLSGRISGRYRLTYGGRAPAVDSLLAATAQRNGLYLASRNVGDLRRLGATVFDPWTDDPSRFPLQA